MEYPDLLGAVAESHERVAATLAELSDDAARAPSLLPGWSRGHVATHLSRTNNTPELVRAVLARTLERCGWNVPFEIADQIRGLEAFDA